MGNVSIMQQQKVVLICTKDQSMKEKSILVGNVIILQQNKVVLLGTREQFMKE